MHIGSEECEEMTLFTNKIICVPPSSQPSKDDDTGSKDGAPALTVRKSRHYMYPCLMMYEYSVQCKCRQKTSINLVHFVNLNKSDQY